jgi:site-specific recombinase XerD
LQVDFEGGELVLRAAWWFMKYGKLSGIPTGRLMATRIFPSIPPDRLPEFSTDLAEIDGPFARFLEGRCHARFTVAKDRWRLRQLARWLAVHGRNLREVERGQVPALVRRFLPRCCDGTAACYSQTLGRWLKYKGRFHGLTPQPRWQPWLDDYRHFLLNHRGLSLVTVDGNLCDVQTFLRWQFGSRPAVWAQVSVRDIWRYCRFCARHGKPHHANGQLVALRRFLMFVQMRAACPPQLADAVQPVANFGQPTHHKPVLQDSQRHRLLASFDRGGRGGSRDYAMALLMLEMGLRACEVARLHFGAVDGGYQRLRLPGVKASRERELPIPKKVAAALRDYIRHARPARSSDCVFVRYHHLVGLPLTSLAVQQAMSRAYRRCGLPAEISGAHLLRHTFATRLFNRGVSIKGIADLLGHRLLHSSNIYTHVAPSALRRLALPWPV